MGLFGECICVHVSAVFQRELGGIWAEDAWGTPWGDPWVDPWGDPRADPWEDPLDGEPLGGGALGVALADPRETLGGSSEDLWWTLENDCGKHPPADIKAAKVCVHVHRPKERGMCTCGNCQGVYTRTCAQKRGMCKRPNCQGVYTRTWA